jgi:hypothetical protein
MLLLLGALSCSGDSEPDDALSNVESTEHVETVVQRDLPLSGDELPPERNSLKTKSILDAISAGQVAFSNFKGCHIPESLQGDAAKGQFLYAWNETSTIGLVLSFHQLSLENIPIGKTKTLSVVERDAFIMIEIGERVDANFCVPDIKQIPISTVLESQTGTVHLKRTEAGVEASIGKILFRDQYTKQEISFEGLTIPVQILASP